MERTSCVRHPENEPLIILRKWQREACDGNNCAGFLLSMFEYWHNHKLTRARDAKDSNRVATLHGEPGTQEEGLNIWMTEAEIEEALLGEYGRKTIREGLALLEAKGFIRSGANPLPNRGFDKTRHFWFQPKVVNAWLAIHRPLSEAEQTPPQEPNEGEEGFVSHEVKLPQRRRKSASPSGKNAGSRGKNASSYKGTEITTEISTENSPKGEEGGQATPPASLVVIVKSLEELDIVESVEQLPTFYRPPKAARLDVWLTLLRVCQMDLRMKPTAKQAIGLNQVVMRLTDAGLPPEALITFETRWYQSWQGKEGLPPSPFQIKENWTQIMAKRTPTQTNGTNTQNGPDSLTQHQRERRERLSGGGSPGRS